MSRIVILGSGFGALAAIRELRRRGVAADITVVSPRSQLVYLPSLIWVPCGARSGDDLRIPLEGYFRRQGVRWQAGTVQQVLDGGRRVITDQGELRNDYLIVATGGRYLRNLPGIEHAIIPCEGIAAAETLRDRLATMKSGTIAVGFASNPKEPGAVRGPMFEFLFGIDTLLRRQGRRGHFRLIFFNPSKEPGQRLGPAAVSTLLAHMARRGIDTHLGQKPLRFEATRVLTEGGSSDADLILFMPGSPVPPGWMAAHCRARPVASSPVTRPVGRRVWSAYSSLATAAASRGRTGWQSRRTRLTCRRAPLRRTSPLNCVANPRATASRRSSPASSTRSTVVSSSIAARRAVLLCLACVSCTGSSGASKVTTWARIAERRLRCSKRRVRWPTACTPPPRRSLRGSVVS